MAGAGRVVATQDVCKVIEVGRCIWCAAGQRLCRPLQKRAQKCSPYREKPYRQRRETDTGRAERFEMKAQTRALFLLPAPVRRTPPNILSVLAVVCIAEFLLAVAAYGLWRHFH